MTTNDIIRMAREAGLVGLDEPQIGIDETMRKLILNFMPRFVALVAAAEREACAKVCDKEMEYAETWGTWGQVMTADKIANAIRARGQG